MEKERKQKTEQLKDNGKELALSLTGALFRFMSKNPDATVGDAIVGLSLFTATFFVRVDKEYKSEGKEPFSDFLEMLMHDFRLGREFAKHGFKFDIENGGNKKSTKKAKGEDNGK